MPWFYSSLFLDKPAFSSTAEGLAMERFALTEDYARETYDQATALLSTLENFDYTVPAEWQDLTVDEEAPNLGEAPVATHPGEYISGITDLVFPDIQALRTQLELVEAEIDEVILPPLDAIYGGLVPPDEPSTAMPDVPTDVPPITDADIPAKPDYTLPDPPTLEDITLPPVPTLNEISFEGTMPTMDITPPEPLFVYDEETYSSNVADALRTKLYQDITLGGTGLDSDTEAAMIARAIDALDVELEKTYNDTIEIFGSMGHEFPPGALAANLRQDIDASNRNRTNLTRDILIQQSNLAQENTHFAITSGLVHEQQLMGYANQVAQRAFERAKALVEMSVAVYQAKVTAYTAQLEAYKTQAAVFESRIKAELAKVEIYKAQIEGAKLTTEMQRNLVAIYSELIKAKGNIIDLYRAEMEGAKIQSDIDRVKIDAFRAQIDAAIAQIGAVTAEYELYQAKWTGEQIKVEVYGKQIDAYAKQIDAKKVEADINVAEAQLAIESNKDKVAVLGAAIEKYKADASAMVDEEQARVAAYGAKVDAYSAETKARSDHLNAQVARFREIVAAAAVEIDAAIKQIEVYQRTETALKEIQNEAIKAGTNVAAQLAASALSSVSASTQVSDSQNASKSYSANANVNNSRSTSASYLETKKLD